MKDELNCSYNGGGVVYVLTSDLSRSSLQFTKSKKNCEKYIYIYINPDTLQKARKFALRFIHKKPDTLRYAIFLKCFEIGIFIYTKSMTLCVT